MSEPKVIQIPKMTSIFGHVIGVTEYYLKSDADKVINELKGTIAQLEDDAAYWKTKYLDLKNKDAI